MIRRAGLHPSSPVVVLVVVLAALSLLLPAGSSGGEPALDGTGHQQDDAECVRLSDAQLVAQVLGSGLHSATVTDPVATLVREHVGTVVLLGQAVRDAEQVRALVDGLHASAPPGLPPMVAVDEEGGRVARFGRAGITEHLPSARAQAAQWSLPEVRVAAGRLGSQLTALGMDMDLAPVLDLTAGPGDGVIGDRSFSEDAAVAGAYAGAFAAGLRDAGLRTAGKHFPDHGLTATDTHTDGAAVDVSLDVLRSRHLEPYRIALPHLDSIMLAHLTIPALDPALPVSLAPAAVSFLRAELTADGRPWDGLVMTDDLSMQAVADVADQPTAAVMALQAGVDLALVGDPVAAGAARDRILTALHDGEIPRRRLTQAAVRVLRTKGFDGTAITCMVGPTHYSRP